MEDLFAPYQESLDLKELGFDEECLAFYNSTLKTPNELLYPQYGGEVGNWNVENHLISAPIYQQAFRWFREKYDLFISITHYENGYSINDLRRFNTYEEAELACLKMMIKISKTNECQ
jgi:hypothetical protein